MLTLWWWIGVGVGALVGGWAGFWYARCKRAQQPLWRVIEWNAGVDDDTPQWESAQQVCADQPDYGMYVTVHEVGHEEEDE